jgi:methanogenic corrinoid protein MtbC1
VFALDFREILQPESGQLEKAGASRKQQNVIEGLRKGGLREQVKVMVGGTVLSQRLADEFGADGFAPDAAWAVRLAKRLMANRGACFSLCI